MARVYNYSAGPAALPEDVLKKAASELVEYNNAGMSVMEMSHRSSEFTAIIESAEATLRDIMNIPDNYRVLFLQGGATSQFAMVPLNLKKSGKVDFAHTGQWTKKAISEAKKYMEVNIVASSEETTFNFIPDLDPSTFTPDADYFHICSNNTIYGTRYTKYPDTGSVPLVADMSSHILSEKIDVSRFGIIFAGAQKNIGPAGVTIVIIRDDLIGHAQDWVPTMMDYKTHSDSNSLYNTPPTYGIYMAGLVFQWVKDQGGVEAMEKKNLEKARILYDYLDSSSLFHGTVRKEDRSLMNVPFKTDSEDMDAKFIKEAKNEGLVTLKGHRSVGGMRASIYNAMPKEGVEKLVAFMKEFEEKNRG
jgi:phosphoserine aminotransferase